MLCCGTRLNLVYLVSDVLFHIVTLKDAEKVAISTALARDLVFILHSTCFGQTPENLDTISRVVAMWGDRGVLDPGFVHGLHTAMRSAEKPPLDPLPVPSMHGAMMGMGPPMQGMMQQGAMGPGPQPHGYGPAPTMAVTAEAVQRAQQLPIGLLIQHQRPGHRPYQPLDPSTLPATTPPKRAPSADLIWQLDQLYAKLDLPPPRAAH